MDLQLKHFSDRVIALKDGLMTEEATKTALIMPFFNLLGYDVFNPLEFIPEFTADVGIKKGEKVDYAIKNDGHVSILIEAKSVGTDLTKVDGQLARYFHVTDAKIAILTDGVIYKIYSDIDKANIMDTQPFFEFDLTLLTSSQQLDIQKFTKENFVIENILGLATDLKYISLLIKRIQTEMLTPSDEFAKIMLTDIYEGPKTKQVLEKFTPIIKKAFNQLILEKVETKLNNAIHGIKDEPEITEIKNKIRTTEDELQFYQIIKSLLIGHIDLQRITYRDAETYFNILLDDNGRKWICRVKFLKDGSVNVIFKDETLNFPTLNDIYSLKDRIIKITLELSI
ncbi:MAG: type I restriction endonuclease [Culicoidibacterales bacterium]